MGKKYRELAEGHARLEGKIESVAAALGQPQREGSWTRAHMVVTLVVTAITLVIGTVLTLRQLRQAELANVLSATPMVSQTPEEESERARSALRKWGRGEFTDTAVQPEVPSKPLRGAPPPTPTLVGVMQADSGKVDSTVAQLAAASSPIIPMDSAGNPYLRGPDGRARVQVAAAKPAGTQDGSGGSGMRRGGGGGESGPGNGRMGLWVGPYGELICAGTCAPGQVCCERSPDSR